ncbi:MAG: NADH-quinone oxidoreductase subunit C [Pseudomonadota bacterium]
MNGTGLDRYLDALRECGATPLSVERGGLAPAHRIVLEAPDWADVAAAGAAAGARHAGLWGDEEEEDGGFRLYAALELDGDHLVATIRLPAERPEAASHAPWFPGVDRLERHARDLLGLNFFAHPDPRRWTRHQAWRADCFPLRQAFAEPACRPPRARPDSQYPFAAIQGREPCEIPVGPVHAGIIEPGHFRFQILGEEILRLEQRLGYTHKGIERLARGRDAAALARLAGRVSGDSTVAHAWAACQAMERAAGCPVPPRAHALRALLAERERIAAHLGDIGEICNDVAFAFAHSQCARLRELWLRRNAERFGHRLLMDLIVPGGVRCDPGPDDLAALRADHTELRRAIAPVFAVIADHPSLDDRLIGAGVLRAADARALGCTGPVARASGLGFDLRRDSPYPPYDRHTPELAVRDAGDVAARVGVRMREIELTLELFDRLLDPLPEGPASAPFTAPAGAAGLGLVEGWRGEILTFVRFDGAGRIARFFPRDPSWFHWPALERLIAGNIVPDFPVCNKSVNGSYSGVDL